ncbi:MAG TPA: PLP-dependent aspartate aminotransferase family protein, partial [Trueperaceae bacterium]|nr:PLP-dependent aspartate aminotransferase family protein [Trueperaceae bacterium]
MSTGSKHDGDMASSGAVSRFATRAVRAGQSHDEATGAHATPIFQTSTFVLGSVERSALLFDGLETGDIYSRIGNPTVHAAENKLAALEGAEAAVAFASGMGAIAALFLSTLRSGDEVLYLGPLYGGTHGLLHELLSKFGVTTRRVTDRDLAGAVGPDTRLIYAETPTNPTLAIHDLAALAAVGKRHGVLTAVDNTFATPCLTRPLELGIDVVLHSATKYLGGHGDLLGGFAAGSAELMTTVRMEGLRHVGATLDPHAAYLLLRGMRTLHVRMAAHCSNARAVATALRDLPGVTKVHYPGFTDHPGHDVAAQQMSDFGAMVSVEFEGGLPAASAFLDSLKLVDHAVSLGDVASLACVPAASTHRSTPVEERSALGISDSLVRISVGIEDAADLVADVTQAARAA